MTQIFQSPGSRSDDVVVTTVDEEIRREALRQVDSIDCDDDHWRIEPLPTFLDSDSDDGAADGAGSGESGGAAGLETTEVANRHNN